MENSDVPLVFVYLMPAPDAMGLEVAVWPNGVVLRAPSELDVGRCYQQGQMADVDLRNVRDLIKTMGLYDSRSHGRVLWDAASEYLVLRTTQSSLCRVHSPDIADAADLRITALRKVLLSLPMSDIHEVTLETVQRAGWRLPEALEGDRPGGGIPARDPQAKKEQEKNPDNGTATCGGVLLAAVANYSFTSTEAASGSLA